MIRKREKNEGMKEPPPLPNLSARPEAMPTKLMAHHALTYPLEEIVVLQEKKESFITAW